MNSRKVIVVVAPTGGMARKSENPNLPTQPEEIAESVYRCWERGASVVALHARNKEDLATCDSSIYRRINSLIRARCDIVINNSTGGGTNGDMIRSIGGGYDEIIFEERVKGAEAGAEMCTLDAQTIICSFEDREILMNTSPKRSKELARLLKEKRTKPEWEFIASLDQERDISWSMCYDTPPYVVNMVLGAHRGFQGALPYTPKILQTMVDFLPQASVFFVSAIGASQLPATTHTILLGGHIRVGLEDNFYYARGRLATNEDLVECAVRIIRELGQEPATATEAREIMGLAPVPTVRTT